MQNSKFWNTILFLGDLILVVACTYFSMLLRFGFDYPDFEGWLGPFRHFTGASIFSIVTVMLTLYIAEMYRTEVTISRLKQILRLLFALGLSIVLISFISYWIPHYRVWRLTSLYNIALMAVCLPLWRFWFFTLVVPGLPKKKVLILGAGRTGSFLVSEIRERHSLYTPVGFIDDDPELQGRKIEEIPVLSDSETICDIARENNASTIIVSTRHGLKENALRNLMKCKSKGMIIRDTPSVFKEISGKIPILHVDDSWFVFGPSFQLVSHPWTRLFQRAFDIVLSSVGLILASPLMLLAVALIKLDSPGPIIFQQERVGLNEKPYTLYKFRTMRPDAEKDTGPVWAKANDDRVTKVGRFLRRSRIDEIPQLWNVLIGEMSFIGPRPERAKFVEELKRKIPYYPLRFLVKPGLSGWAQVNYKYGASEDDALEKLQYELYYLQEMSIFLNILIILRTVQTVLFHRGS